MSKTSPQLQVRSKIWLEIDGEPVLGHGRDKLLRLIQQQGSINAAAKAMGIPYRKAWTYIDTMEKRLGFAMVNRLKGGAGGGESSLTREAEALLEKFALLQQGIAEMVNGKFDGLDFPKGPL
jgi:molybdate transport system regulatory protein